MKLSSIFAVFFLYSFGAQANDEILDNSLRRALREKRRGCEAILKLVLEGGGKAVLVRPHDFNLIALGRIPHTGRSTYHPSEALHMQLDLVPTNPNFMRVQTVYDGQILTKFIGFDGKAVEFGRDLFDSNAGDSALIRLNSIRSRRDDPAKFTYENRTSGLRNKSRTFFINPDKNDGGAAIQIREKGRRSSRVIFLERGTYLADVGYGGGTSPEPISVSSLSANIAHNEIAAFIQKGHGQTHIKILHASSLTSAGSVNTKQTLKVSGFGTLIQSHSLRYSPDGRYLSLFPFCCGEPIVFRRDESGNFVRLQVQDAVYVKRPKFPGGEIKMKDSTKAVNPEFTGFVDSLYSKDSDKLALATDKGLLWIIDLNSLGEAKRD